MSINISLVDFIVLSEAHKPFFLGLDNSNVKNKVLDEIIEQLIEYSEHHDISDLSALPLALMEEGSTEVDIKTISDKIIELDYAFIIKLSHVLTERNYSLDDDENTLINAALLAHSANNFELSKKILSLTLQCASKKKNKIRNLHKTEKTIVSYRQKEISNKRPKHQFYDESIRKAEITWQHFPTVSYARMAKALDSFFGDGVSREAIEGWLKDAKLRPEGPVRKTSFTLMG